MHKSGPLLCTSTSFKNDCPLQVSRRSETGNALDTLCMKRKKKKKQLKPEGSAGAVKQVVPFPLRLKATAKLCVGLDPCA